METIVLDWSALSQVVQQGETGALEQALRSTGAKLAITDHGVVDIPKAFSADFSKDTKENRRTGSDWLQGGYDEDGYGPRMTLSYDDEAGERRAVTESFQANVDRAWQRSRMTHMARLRKTAEEFGLTQPKQSEAEAKPMVPEADPNPTNIPVPQAKPAPGIHVHDTQTPEA